MLHCCGHGAIPLQFSTAGTVERFLYNFLTTRAVERFLYHFLNVCHFYRGLGACKPSSVESRAGMCSVPVGPQSCRPACKATLWVSLCAMEKPPEPSSWVSTIITCLCRGGTVSTVQSWPRVDTTLYDSWQSHRTCIQRSLCLFSTMTTSPAQPLVR